MLGIRSLKCSDTVTAVSYLFPVFLFVKVEAQVSDFLVVLLPVVSAAIPPRVTEEADRMMRKLRDLQSQVDERVTEVARKESQLHMLEAEKDSAIKRLRDAEGEFL